VKIKITTKNLTLTPPLQEYINEKMGALDRFFGENTELTIMVEISKITKHHKKGDFFETIVGLDSGSNTFRAESRTFDIRVAIDEVRVELERQLISRRGKWAAQYLRGARLFKRFAKFSPLAWFRSKKGHRVREEGI